MKTPTPAGLTLTLSLLGLAACGGAEPAASASAPASATGSPSSTPTTTASVAPPSSASASAPVLPAPKTSALQVNGTSVSDVSGEQLKAALAKLGWGEADVPLDQRFGRYEQVTVAARKSKAAKESVSVTVTRQARQPQPPKEGVTESDFSPTAVQKLYATNDDVAQVYDAEADVLVSVMYAAKGAGAKKAQAQKLVDALLKAGK
jgi:hypothetical protein